MGAWGVGIWDNDEALDALEGFRDKAIRSESIEKAYFYIKGNDRQNNSDELLLALAGIQIKYDKIIDIPILEEALDYCIKKSDAEDYRDPKAREHELDKFGKIINKFLTEKVGEYNAGN